MLQQLQTIVNNIIQHELELLYRKQNAFKQNYEKLNTQQFKKVEQTFKENQTAKWSHYQYSCDFFNQEKLLYLRQQIEFLLDTIIKELPSVIATSMLKKMEEDLENQKRQIIENDKDKEFFSFNQANNNSLQEYFAQQNKLLRDEIMLKEVEIRNDAQVIRTMRIEKIEVDQSFKQLIFQYEQVLKQNSKQQEKIKSLEIDIKQLQKQQDQTTKEMFERSKDAQIKIIQTQPNEVSISHAYMEQKISHMEHAQIKYQENIAKLQERNQQLQLQISQEQLMNHNLYSNLVNLDAQSDNAIQLKNKILNDLEELKKNSNQKTTPRKTNHSQQDESPQAQEKQWNRLILYMSKLQNDKRMLIEKIADLLNELFKSSQFLLNLFDLIDKPDFIVNLKSIRTICAQQREIVSDRLFEIVKEKQLLGDEKP